MKTLSDIPRKLTKKNIESTINDYHNLLGDIPLKIESENILELLKDLKRRKINHGPYPNVTIFESSNRIMTDLTILYGIRALLNREIPELDYDMYKVEFGHDNYNDFDIMAIKGDQILRGEAFNVAEQFFQTKKSKMLAKLRDNRSNSDQILLIYNSDAVSENYTPKLKSNEFHLKVNIESEYFK